jgi:hypothetical protein
MCQARQAVKLISANSYLVFSNRDIIKRFIEFQFPDGTHVYRGAWDDYEGLAILMDDYASTLRNHIDPNTQITERQWIVLMLGIVDRLSTPHQQNIAHGDLCPSNSFLKFAI